MNMVSEELRTLEENTPLWKPPEPEKPKEYYYDAERKEYLKRTSRRWIALSESQFKKQLLSDGISGKKGKDEPLSDVDKSILDIRENYNVDYAGSLAGYNEGFHEICGSAVLITDSPQIIKPIPGDCSMILRIIDNLFTADCDKEQYYRFIYWMKIAVESLINQTYRTGQALVIAGERDCGKSFLQKIITEIFGGRAAMPYMYMSGRTDFNGDLFCAEHLMIEDEACTSDIRSRIAFGSRIKQITANDTQQCHAKHRQALTLKPFWRLSITLNDEPEHLQILPPIDESISDKLIILRAYRKPMPMPTASGEQREQFWSEIMKQLPAFVDYLVKLQLPENLKSERYGVKEYHNPDIIQELQHLAPESKLLSMIDNVLFTGLDGSSEWYGTASDLEKILLQNSDTSYDARKLFTWPAACGVYLGRLEKNGRVKKDRKEDKRSWIIHRS